MAMNLNSQEREDELMVDINTTPLVDVLLVLLVMLIITIPVQFSSVTIDMPGESPPPLVRPVVVSLDVLPGGAIAWNGEPLADRAALDARPLNDGHDVEQAGIGGHLVTVFAAAREHVTQ